jgi:hypothetical protein
MGLETTCRVRSGGKAYDAKVLLETDELIVRGEERQRVPFSAIRRIDAADGELRIEHTGGSLTFALGDAAARWAERIRSPRSLLDKLGVRANQSVSVLGVDDAKFAAQLASAGARVTTGRIAKGADIIFIGAATPRELSRLSAAAKAMARDGAIWVVHPKGKGALKDTEIFAAAKALGLVSTKVARFSETHTAEKLVIPVAHR